MHKSFKLFSFPFIKELLPSDWEEFIFTNIQPMKKIRQKRKQKKKKQEHFFLSKMMPEFMLIISEPLGITIITVLR